ncbi:MAG: hypothetical protein MHM6MM_002386 [Cercozoa sp. M6MM]
MDSELGFGSDNDFDDLNINADLESHGSGGGRSMTEDGYGMSDGEQQDESNRQSFGVSGSTIPKSEDSTYRALHESKASLIQLRQETLHFRDRLYTAGREMEVKLQDVDNYTDSDNVETALVRLEALFNSTQESDKVHQNAFAELERCGGTLQLALKKHVYTAFVDLRENVITAAKSSLNMHSAITHCRMSAFLEFLEQIEREFAAFAQTHEDMKQDKSVIGEQYSQSKQRLADLKQQEHENKQQVEQQQVANAKLHSQKQAAEQERQLTQDLVDESTKQRQQAQGAIESRKKDSQELQRKCAEAREHIQQLREELQKQSRDNMSQKQELLQARSRKDHSQFEAQSIRREIESNQRYREAEQRRTDNSQSILRNCQKQLSEMELQNEKHRSDLEQLSDGVLSRREDSLRQELQRCETTVRDTVSKTWQLFQHVRTEVSQRRQQLTQLRAQASEQTERTALLHKRIRRGAEVSDQVEVLRRAVAEAHENAQIEQSFRRSLQESHAKLLQRSKELESSRDAKTQERRNRLREEVLQQRQQRQQQLLRAQQLSEIWQRQATLLQSIHNALSLSAR